MQDPNLDIQERQQYRSLKDKLVVHEDNILQRDNIIVMPTFLGYLAISLTHEGHQVLTKTKAFIRSKVWFPGINDRVDSLITNCMSV